MDGEDPDRTPASSPPEPTNRGGGPGGEPPMDLAPPPRLPDPFGTENVNAGKGPYDPRRRGPRG